MFEFDLPNSNNIMTPSAPDSTAITQEEVAEVIRLSETYSLSSVDQVKLLLLVRKLKNQNQSRHH